MKRESAEASPAITGDQRSQIDQLAPGEERVIELREEQLNARKQLREIGEVIVRTEVDTVPARLEVDAMREEVEVVHEPVGRTVAEREDPSEEDGVLVVPVYEEQLVVTKRLVLRERLHVRRVRTTERQLFEETVKRERLIVEDPQETGLVHERYPTDDMDASRTVDTSEGAAAGEPADSNFLTKLVIKALE